MYDREQPTITERDLLNLGFVKTKHLNKKQRGVSSYCYVYLYSYLIVFMKKFDCEEEFTPALVRHTGDTLFLESKEELKKHIELWMEYKEEPIKMYKDYHKLRVKEGKKLRSFS